MTGAVREAHSRYKRRDRARQVVVIVYVERCAAGNMGYGLVEQ